MPSIKELALMSHQVYDDPKDLDKTNKRIVCPGWIVHSQIIKISTGFQAAVFKKEDSNERIVVYCGSNELVDWKVDNCNIFLGEIPPQADYAMKLFEMAAKDNEAITQDSFENYKCSFTGDCYNRNEGTLSADILVTGHSLGGALAVIVANKYKACAVAFNSPGIVGLTNVYDLMKHLTPEMEAVKERAEEIGEEAARKEFSQIENNLLDMVNAFKKRTEIRVSEGADQRISNFYIEGDLAHNVGIHIGESYCVGKVYGIANILFDAHTISQWTLVERYDSQGELDPEIKENLTKSQRRLIEFKNGYQWRRY